MRPVDRPDSIGPRLEVGERLLASRIEFHQTLQVHEGVPERRLKPAACRQAVEQAAPEATIRRIAEARKDLRSFAAPFDAEVDTPAHGIRADQRNDMPVEKRVDLVEFFGFSGDRAADRDLASEREWPPIEPARAT